MEKHYFPGGNTNHGFYNLYKGITQNEKPRYIYYIKGGPGVGKSTFMKKAAQKDTDVSYYHCSSDSDSLDAVYLHNKQIMITDGTAPHIQDPKYPGAYDTIVDLGKFFKTEKLKKHRKQIENLTDEISLNFSYAYDFLGSLPYIYKNLERIYKNTFKENLLTKQVDKLLFDFKENGVLKEERRLFLEAYTPKGKISYASETINAGTNYIIDKRPGDMTYYIFNLIYFKLKSKGHYQELFLSPINPETHINHIHLPYSDIAFVSSFTDCPYKNKGIKIFTDVYSNSRADREEILFNENIINLLTARSIFYIKNAHRLHDELESYYISAMDFNSLNEFTEEFLEKL